MTLHSVKNIVINPEELRLRAGWRISIQLFLFILAYIISLEFWFDSLNIFSNELLGEIVFFAFGLLSVIGAVKYLDRRSLADIGLVFRGRGIANFSSGFLLGASIFAVLFAVELILGWVEIEGLFRSKIHFSFSAELIGRFTGYLSVAILEESFSRGYHIKNIAEGLSGIGNPKKSAYSALVISAVIFSLLHGLNPNATAFGLFNLFLIGIFFGYSYFATASLAFPIGLHTAWNFFQGNVFGFPVSGFESYVSILSIKNDGPAWLTGGKFGPEGGIIVFIIVLIAIILLNRFKNHLGCDPEFVNQLTEYKRREAG